MDRVSISSHLRLLADLIESEGCGPTVMDRVSQIYDTPKLVKHDTGFADIVKSFRAKRDQMFGGELFGEPAWEMLLELFQARQVDRRLSVKSLTIASKAPQTTAGRYLADLITRGLTKCIDDPSDGRRKLIELTHEGYRRMDELFVEAA